MSRTSSNISRNKRELTEGFLQAVTVDGRRDFSDTKVEGLQLRVTTSGRKTFSVRKRMPNGRSQRVTLGEYPNLRLKEARALARETIVDLARGRNFNAEKRMLRSGFSTDPTLGDLLIEYEEIASNRLIGIWEPRGPSKASQARQTIGNVFRALLPKKISTISEEDLAAQMIAYRRKGRTGTTKSANGQVSHARAYLMPPLNWASGRGKFKKLGAGRPVIVDAPDLSRVFDPAVSDPSITGKRDRVLSDEEVEKILPWLTWPARSELSMRCAPEMDFRPIAIRFILLQALRRGEVERMRWQDIDLKKGTLWKPKLETGRRGKSRGQILHLSDAAIDLLRRLPQGNPNDFVFPNESGGQLGNWARILEKIKNASKTKNWTLHDLRRTSSTVMNELGTDAGLIAKILGHGTGSDDERTRTAWGHYIVERQHVRREIAPAKLALDKLAAVYADLE